MKTLNKVSGLTLDPTSVDEISSSLDLTGAVDELRIAQITGEVDLHSKITNLKLFVDIKPVIDIDLGLLQLRNRTNVLPERLVKKFKELGFDNNQIQEIGEVMSEETPVFKDFSDVKMVDLDNESGVEELSANGILARVELPIPFVTIPINVKPKIDMKNVQIGPISASAQTTLTAEDITTSSNTMDDFQFTAESPELIAYKTLQINDAQVKPISIPVFKLPDWETKFNITKILTKLIQINVNAKNGHGDFSSDLITWKPRAGGRGCIDLWLGEVCATVKFGFDLTIGIKGRWVMDSLDVKAKIIDLSINGIHATIKLVQTTLKTCSIGLVKMASLLSQKL